MTPNVDPYDIGFKTGLQNLLKIDSDHVTKIIEKLGINELNDLSDAVQHGDKDSALRIIKGSNVNESAPVFLNSGDLVEIDDGVIGRVYKPSTPGNTVGVVIKGKQTVIDRKQIKKVVDRSTNDKNKVEEGVLGMTMMPGLNRMRALAGIPAEETNTAVDNCDAQVPQPAYAVDVQVEHPGMDDLAACACAALDSLEQALPGVSLKDIKMIRKRLADITQMINEGLSYQPRKRKD